MNKYLFILSISIFSYCNKAYSMTQEPMSLNEQKNVTLAAFADPNQQITEELYDQIKDIYQQLDSESGMHFAGQIHGKVMTSNINRYEPTSLKEKLRVWSQMRLLKKLKLPPVAPPQE